MNLPNKFWRYLVALGAGLYLSGCACCHPGRSCNLPDPVGRKVKLVQNDFCPPRQFTAPSGHIYPIYTPNKALANPQGPPVLLLHEMPALSAEALELAQRIASHSYRVYVPLLFGNVDDNPANNFAAIFRILGKILDPLWHSWQGDVKQPAHGDVQRPVARDIAAMARMIAQENRGKRLGAIGMCFSGPMPLALLGQEEPLPELVAPVLSQPALPFPSCDAVRRNSVGMSELELDRARARIEKGGLEVLGFRFEKDKVSPPERFTKLEQVLNPSPGEKHFVDGTVRAARYHCVDGLPLNAHPVLTDGYRSWRPGRSEPATHYAYRELIAFLDEKLKGPAPRKFVAPKFDPKRTVPICDAGDPYGGHCVNDPAPLSPTQVKQCQEELRRNP